MICSLLVLAVVSKYNREASLLVSFWLVLFENSGKSHLSHRLFFLGRPFDDIVSHPLLCAMNFTYI